MRAKVWLQSRSLSHTWYSPSKCFLRSGREEKKIVNVVVVVHSLSVIQDDGPSQIVRRRVAGGGDVAGKRKEKIRGTVEPLLVVGTIWIALAYAMRGGSDAGRRKKKRNEKRFSSHDVRKNRHGDWTYVCMVVSPICGAAALMSVNLFRCFYFEVVAGCTNCSILRRAKREYKIMVIHKNSRVWTTNVGKWKMRCSITLAEEQTRGSRKRYTNRGKMLRFHKCRDDKSSACSICTPR